MYICPVCGKKSKTENAICSSCRFDHSRNYEVYATISPLKGKNNLAISKKRLDYEGKKQAKVSSTQQLSSSAVSTSVQKPALKISPFALQKFPFVSVQYSSYAAAIKENGEITYTGMINVGESECFSQWKDIKALVGDGFHTVALKSDGTVAAVGDNTYGQWNVSLWRNIAAITTGSAMIDRNLVRYTLALRSDGTIAATKDTPCRDKIQQWKDIISVAVGDDDNKVVGLKADELSLPQERLLVINV